MSHSVFNFGDKYYLQHAQELQILQRYKRHLIEDPFLSAMSNAE